MKMLSMDSTDTHVLGLGLPIGGELVISLAILSPKPSMRLSVQFNESIFLCIRLK